MTDSAYEYTCSRCGTTRSKLWFQAKLGMNGMYLCERCEGDFSKWLHELDVKEEMTAPEAPVSNLSFLTRQDLFCPVCGQYRTSFPCPAARAQKVSCPICGTFSISMEVPHVRERVPLHR